MGVGFLVSPVVQGLGVGIFGVNFGWHFAAYGPHSPPGIRCGDGCDAPEKSGWQNRICTDASGRCRPMIHLTTMRLLTTSGTAVGGNTACRPVITNCCDGPIAPRIDVSKLGPQVGELVPDFTLKDQNGKTWTLQSIMGPKGAMLVFTVRPTGDPTGRRNWSSCKDGGRMLSHAIPHRASCPSWSHEDSRRNCHSSIVSLTRFG